MFVDTGSGVFLNTDYIGSMVLVSDFTEEGTEQWFIKAFGCFQLPDRYLQPDGSVIIGPFSSREEALKFIGFADSEIVFEAEDVEAH